MLPTNMYVRTTSVALVVRAGYARWLCAGCALRLCAKLSCPRPTPCPVSLFLPRFLFQSLSCVPVLCPYIRVCVLRMKSAITYNMCIYL